MKSTVIKSRRVPARRRRPQNEFATAAPTRADGVPSTPPLPPAATARLDALLAGMERLSSTFVGFPCSQDCDYPELTPFLRFALNNVGDPFGESIYRENMFAFEREVVAFSQKHLRAPAGETWAT